jgi:hypothetical protein
MAGLQPAVTAAWAQQILESGQVRFLQLSQHQPALPGAGAQHGRGGFCPLYRFWVKR